MNPPDGDLPEPGPLPNRFTRGTALGCLGIACVFAFPLFLYLPIEDWHLPAWLTQALALGAFAAMSAGIWMLMRVPTTRGPAATDVWHPVTRAGRAPVVEQPASIGNRLVLMSVLLVGVVAAIAYTVSATATRRDAVAVSLAAVVGAGVAGVALGALVALGQLPVPAWTWARTPIHLRPRPQGIAIALFGAAALGWALLAGAGAGFGWGRVGLAALLLCSVLVTPLAQRWPRRSARTRALRGRPLRPSSSASGPPSDPSQTDTPDD